MLNKEACNTTGGTIDNGQVFKNETIVFHFNKAHLNNPDIPMWVLKVKGNTYYVKHVKFSNVSFESKETPQNSHTKGSLKLKASCRINNEEALIWQ